MITHHFEVTVADDDLAQVDMSTGVTRQDLYANLLHSEPRNRVHGTL